MNKHKKEFIIWLLLVVITGLFIFAQKQKDSAVELAVLKVCKRMAYLQVNHPTTDYVGGLMEDKQALYTEANEMSAGERSFNGRCIDASKAMDLIK